MLAPHQSKFIQLAIEYDVLKFGDFTLKSGRQSPYFFNAGLFNDANSLQILGQCYAQTIIESDFSFDHIFGPAYKGIPLATATALALNQMGINKTLTFNRKEAKNHGEGGMLMGASLASNTLIIDDVITAGTAFYEAKSQIESQGAQVSAVMIALDRCERGTGDKSTLKDIEEMGIGVASIITIHDLCHYLNHHGENEKVIKIKNYQSKYGC